MKVKEGGGGGAADGCISLVDVGPVCYLAKAAHTLLLSASVPLELTRLEPAQRDRDCWDFHLGRAGAQSCGSPA